MKKIKVKYDDDDIQVVEVKRVNNNVNKHFVGALNAIRIGMKWAGRSSRHE